MWQNQRVSVVQPRSFWVLNVGIHDFHAKPLDFIAIDRDAIGTVKRLGSTTMPIDHDKVENIMQQKVRPQFRLHQALKFAKLF